jgi:hypothetical protein
MFQLARDYAHFHTIFGEGLKVSDWQSLAREPAPNKQPWELPDDDAK